MRYDDTEYLLADDWLTIAENRGMYLFDWLVLGAIVVTGTAPSIGGIPPDRVDGSVFRLIRHGVFEVAPADASTDEADNA